MNEIVMLREWVLMLIIFISVISGALVGCICICTALALRKPARLG